MRDMSTSRRSTRLIEQVLLVVFCALTTSASDCVFPTFMTRIPYWRTNVTSVHIQGAAMWTFPNPSTAQMTDLTSWPQMKTNFSCRTAINHDTFLTSIARDDVASSLYQCMRFIRRSDFVVQLAHTSVSSTRSSDQCLDSEQFQLEDSVLVHPRRSGTISGDAISCGLVGGFWLSVIDSSGSHTCLGSFLRPIIEADCALPGEGVLIDFRQQMCSFVSSSVTATLHHMVCLGSWNQSGFTFSVLTDNRILPKLWMLRIPERASGPITAHLLTSLSTSSAHSTSTDQHALSLTRASFPTLCENEAAGCDVTQCADDTTEAEVRCQKTCDACAVTTSTVSCRFNDSDHGHWIEMSHRYDDDANRFITV